MPHLRSRSRWSQINSIRTPEKAGSARVRGRGGNRRAGPEHHGQARPQVVGEAGLPGQRRPTEAVRSGRGPQDRWRGRGMGRSSRQ